MHKNLISLTTILGALLLLMSNYAIAAIAAKVDFSSGNPTISDINGQSRPAIKGVDVASGEIINTHQGLVQLRFTDGGRLSLQSNTSFRIDDYTYSGAQDGTERNFSTLLKGGLRTVTGLIGKKHKESYKLDTAAATIGIRGTEFLVKFDGALAVHVVNGEILVQNSAGAISLVKGQSARVTNEKSPPQQTDAPPQMEVKTLATPFNYVASDDRTSAGTQSIISSTNNPSTWTISGNASPLPARQGYTIAYSLGMASVSSTGQGLSYTDSLNNISVSNDTTGLATICQSTSTCSLGSTISGGLTVYTDSNVDDVPDTLDSDMKRVFASYDNGTIGLGSWISGTMWAAGWKNMPLGGYHYVMGIPSTTMPTTGTATYSLAGATAPTYSHGNTQLGSGSLTSASMTVDFRTNLINGNLGFNFTGGKYSTNFSGSASSATFSANGMTVMNEGSTNVCGTTGCSTQINGLFAGTSAKNAGLVYLIQSNQMFTINGAAVLQKPQ